MSIRVSSKPFPCCYCQGEFIRSSSRATFCSELCKLHGSTDRRNGPEHPKLGRCWEWTASVFRTMQYGQFRRFDGRTRAAHQVAWELANNTTIPEGWLILHKCDNNLCVNPDHLYLGTYDDNANDRMSRGGFYWSEVSREKASQSALRRWSQI